MEVFKSSRFRAISAQAIAAMSKNLLQIDVGLCLAFPEILIAALIGLNAEMNPNENLRITAEQASWLGSIGIAAQVIGGIFSGFIAEAIGRKTALCVINIPLFTGWLLLYSAQSLAQIYIAALLFGLSIGLINSPSSVYVGEISEISIRNILTALTAVSTTSGSFTGLLLGILADWRNAALYCSIVPLTAFIILLFIPETPVWLLSKNRDEDALKSLCWLRGWTTEQAVQKEFEELQSYRKFTNTCTECQNDQVNCTHPPPILMDKFKALFKSNCMRPIMIFLICSLFTNFTGLHHVFPFAAQILNTFHCPFNPNKAIPLFGAASFSIAIILAIIVKFVGKRSIFLVSLAGMAVCNLSLGIYAILYLPFGARSFDYDNTPTSSNENGSYFPLIVLICSRIFTTGLIEVPFMFCSELFPLKARCFAAGICSTMFSLVLFITTKTFYDMEKWFSLSITFCIYGVTAFIGIIGLYRIIPRTDNVSLADIERHFTNKQHKWTDWKIASYTSTNK